MTTPSSSLPTMQSSILMLHRTYGDIFHFHAKCTIYVSPSCLKVPTHCTMPKPRALPTTDASPVPTAARGEATDPLCPKEPPPWKALPFLARRFCYKSVSSRATDISVCTVPPMCISTPKACRHSIHHFHYRSCTSPVGSGKASLY